MAKIVISHWDCLIENFQYAPLDFYALVADAAASRKLPDCDVTTFSALEGGILSSFRTYLRIKRYNYIFEICAAPFGNSFFISWWLSIRVSWALHIPVLSWIIRHIIDPATMYQVDSALMFQKSVDKAVQEVIDRITAQKGLRALSEAERKPILYDFFKR